MKTDSPGDEQSPAVAAFRQLMRAVDAGDPVAVARCRRDLFQLGWDVRARGLFKPGRSGGASEFEPDDRPGAA